MMIVARLTLLVFGAIGFAGVGAALALARQRRANEAQSDNAMTGLAAVLAAFGSLCTSTAAGWPGVFAFGGAIVFAAYVITARQVGLFEIERGHAADLEEAAQQHR